MIYSCFSALFPLSLEDIKAWTGAEVFGVFLAIPAKLRGVAEGRDFESVSQATSETRGNGGTVEKNSEVSLGESGH